MALLLIYGNIAFVERTNQDYSEKVQAVKNFFERADIPYTIPENMLHSLWRKFMFNVVINQCSAVMRGRFGEDCCISKVMLAFLFREETIFDCTVPYHLKNKFERSKFMDVDPSRFAPELFNE